jgi:hypothetical protein
MYFSFLNTPMIFTFCSVSYQRNKFYFAQNNRTQFNHFVDSRWNRFTATSFFNSKRIGKLIEKIADSELKVVVTSSMYLLYKIHGTGPSHRATNEHCSACDVAKWGVA